ncbi:MAG: endolytic transglycosylase MltG [Solirubrobacteraceae bacterium]
MADSRERTAAEREAARLERERRRQQRPAEPASPAEVDAPAEIAPSAEAASPASDGDGVGVDREWDGAAVSTESRTKHADLDGYDSLAQGAELTGDSEMDDDYDFADSTEEHELPSGTRRVTRHERIGSGGQRPRRAPRPVRRAKRPKPGGGRSKHSIGGRVLAVIAVVGALAAVWFLLELFQPFHSTGHAPVTVTIPRDAGASTIGKILERDGVISSSFFFELRATLAGDRGDLRSGTYHLRQGMSYGDVLKILTTAPPAAKVSNLTIVEGKTRSQIDALLRSQKIRGSYLAATRHSPLLDPHRYGAPRSTSSLEGFLFPSTYQLRDPITVSALVTDQLKTFRQQFGKVNLGYAKSKHLTPFDVLTIASLVQAEAETAHDRPLIASVIYNRLRLGMPLQIDATTRFATGNYTKPLTDSQLNSGSPYNTRNHKGLPPGPIDSPGLASIQAAARPAHTHFLYFVVKPCGNGEHVFESSYSKFLADAQRYQSARTSRGGRSPENCK